MNVHLLSDNYCSYNICTSILQRHSDHKLCFMRTTGVTLKLDDSLLGYNIFIKKVCRHKLKRTFLY